jgi:hypothetical protein
MVRKLKLLTVVAVAVSTLGVTGSAEAHIGRGRGGGGGGIGIRIGGGGIGLVPRARQGNGNAAVPRATTPAPRAPVAPAPAPVVQKPAVPKNSPPSSTTVKSPAPKASVTKASTEASTIPSPTKVPATASGPKAKPAAEPQPQTTDNVVATEVDSGAVDTPLDQPMTFSPETKVILKAAGASTTVESEEAGSVEAKPAETKKVPALVKVPVGATVTLNSKDLSEKEGQVILQIGEIALPATIKQWKSDAVVCTLPIVGLTKASKATLHLLNADGQTASTLTVELVTTLPTSSDALPNSLDAGNFER